MNALPLKELFVDVVEASDHHRKDMIPCRLGQNIKFDLDALDSFSSLKWQATVYDILVVAAAVEFCDRSLARGSRNWGRKFSVHVPVHQPDRWSDKAVNRALIRALNLLTGDDWNFEFRPRKAVAEPPNQGRLIFPSSAEAVMAFSDGMDSRAVAGLVSKKIGSKLVRIRVGNKQRDISKKDRQRAPFAAIPYTVNLDSGRNSENSARNRGFKFSVVSAIACYLIDAPSIVIPESGQGALAPAILPVGQGYEDYRNYPAFTALMEQFFNALLGYKVNYQFPRLWMTKGETLREFVDVCGNEAQHWEKTRSCWQQSRQVGVSGKRRQCGICAACFLRRLSVHAARLSEPTENYVWESLKTAAWEDGASKEFTCFTSALREYSIAGALHFHHLATFRNSVEYNLIKGRRTSELARSLSDSPSNVAQNLDRLLKQHENEWSAFIDDLGPGSFVRQWIGSAS